MLEETLDRLYKRMDETKKDLNETQQELKEKENRVIYLESEFKKIKEVLEYHKVHKCPICLEQITKGQEFVTKCKHRLCGHCSSELIKKELIRNRNVRCPLCRCNII